MSGRARASSSGRALFSRDPAGFPLFRNVLFSGKEKDMVFVVQCNSPILLHIYVLEHSDTEHPTESVE
jgi:hypothetical protein